MPTYIIYAFSIVLLLLFGNESYIEKHWAITACTYFLLFLIELSDIAKQVEKLRDKLNVYKG